MGLPLLDAMMPRVEAAPSQFKPWNESRFEHPRTIFCYVPNGVNIFQWMPQTAGRNYELSPTLRELSDHRDRFSVITGIGHPHAKGGHSGADTWLTGADLQAVPGSDYSNTISVDQVIAESIGKETRVPSLQLSDQSGTGSAGHSHTLSFDRSGIPLPAESSPQQIFERLFVPDTAKDRQALLQRYAEKKSLLDEVQREAKRLHRALGANDRQKFEEYLNSVRETEQRLERLVAWIDVPQPEVSSKDLQLASQPGDAHDRPMWLDVMLELCYLAFITDTTRVIAFEWSREAGGYGGGGENHHELSHHGGDPGMLEKLGGIDRFHLQRLNRFLALLSSTKEGEGNMLDRTLVMYGSGMNSGEGGDHSPKNLPLLLAGGEKLGLSHGQHLAFDPSNHPPLSNLYLTLLHSLAIPMARFQDSTGPLPGIAV